MRRKRRRRLSAKRCYEISVVLAMVICVIVLAMIFGACIVSATAPDEMLTYALICGCVTLGPIQWIGKLFSAYVMAWSRKVNNKRKDRK